MKTENSIESRSRALLARVRQFSHSCQPRKNGQYKAFESFLRDNKSEQLSLLGVHLCGFIFRNPIGIKAELLFDPGGHPYGFPIGWKNPNAKRFKDLIQRLFVVWRSDTESAAIPVPKTLYPPEYLSFLPLPSQYAPGRDRRSKVSMPPLFPCHYCPLGEVLFYLYAWRLLLRHAQVSGLDSKFKPSVVSLTPKAHGGRTRVQFSNVWMVNGINTYLTREAAFLKAFRHHNDATESISVHRRLNGLWAELKSRFDSCRTTEAGWFSDWQVIGLIKPTHLDGACFNGRVGLRAILRFAESVAEDVGRTDFAARLQKHLLLFEESSEPSISATNLLSIDTLLKEIVFSHLALKTKNPTVIDLLLNFHALVRFPAIPYFYSMAVDTTLRCHLVLPVLRSFYSPMETLCWTKKPESFQECRRFDNRSIIRHSVVGVAVLDVSPLEQLDWTCWTKAEQQKQLLSREARLRLETLQQYVELLAQIPADEVFYTQLQRRLFSIKSAHFLHHQVMDPVLQLKAQYALLLDKLTKHGTKSDSAIIMRMHIFEPLIKHCTEQLKIFAILGGGDPKWNAAKFKASEIVRIVGVLLQDKACHDELTPSGKVYLESTVNVAGRPFIVKLEHSRDFLWNVDGYKVADIIRSLIFNSIEAMEQKTIAPVIVIIKKLSARVKVTVTDSGCGIARADVPRIYDLDFSTKKEGGGIGLFLVKKLVTAAGGTVRCKSKINKGTTFTIELPLNQSE